MCSSPTRSTGAGTHWHHAGGRPRIGAADLVLLGKALGGGIIPVSAVAGRDDVIGVLTPGNTAQLRRQPAGVMVAREGHPDPGRREPAAPIGGNWVIDKCCLRAEAPDSVREVRGLGLWAGIEVHPQFAPVRDAAPGGPGRGRHRESTRTPPRCDWPHRWSSTTDLDHGVDVVLAPSLTPAAPGTISVACDRFIQLRPEVVVATGGFRSFQATETGPPHQRNRGAVS